MPLGGTKGCLLGPSVGLRLGNVLGRDAGREEGDLKG